MNFKKYIIIVFLIFPFILNAKREPDRPDWLKEELKKFRFREVPENYIIWDNVNEKVRVGTPYEMAIEFLMRHKNRFGFKDDLSDLKLKRPPFGPEGLYRVEFYQVYKDLPLYDNEVIVNLKEDGTILSVFSSYLPILEEIDTRALISQSEAINIALSYLRIIKEELRDTPSAALMIFPYRGKRLVYKVVFSAENPLGHWHIYIDAKNGEIVHLEDKNVYYSGYGYVFKPDPLTTAHANYGDYGFMDYGDSATYQLNLQRKDVPLLDLKYENGKYYLEDPFNVIITNFGGYQDPRYNSSDGYFYHTRYDQVFEAVCAFYHIRAYQDYLRQIGFGFATGKVYVDPHATYDDQSWYGYINDEDRIYLGEGGVDDAEDADVIIHEFGHCLQRRLMGGFNYNFPESGALSEGYADYLAGSYSVIAANYDQYKKDSVFNWDGHNEFWSGRILNSTKHYPEDMTGDPHKDGEIFSACLWQIWNQYGYEVTDKLALYSLWWLWPSANFKWAAKKILEADYFHYPFPSISHAPFIRGVFYARGILTPPSISLVFPQGGEKFVVGSIELLQWSIYDPDMLSSYVEIYYLKSNQWVQITTVPSFYSIYHWNIPQDYTGVTRIKVELKDQVGNLLSSDLSDPLYIVPKPSLTITFPNGGEIFNVGSTINITWTSSDPNNVIKYLKIYFSQDGGQNYTLIADNVENTGSYSWQVPQIPTLKGKIKIEAYNIRNVLIQIDESDGNFIIVFNSITLLWPNSPSITIEEGKTYYIKYNGTAAFGIKNVTAWLSRDGGQTFPDFVRSKSYSGPPYPNEVIGDTITWNVTQAPTLKGRIKVILEDGVGITCEDISDYDFTIRPATPTNLQANSSSPYNSVYLTWNDNSNYETGYEIWRKDINRDWTKIATVSANSTSYTDNSVSRFNDYFYKVRAISGSITSEFSNTCWVTTSPCIVKNLYIFPSTSNWCMAYKRKSI